MYSNIYNYEISHWYFSINFSKSVKKYEETQVCIVCVNTLYEKLTLTNSLT